VGSRSNAALMHTHHVAPMLPHTCASLVSHGCCACLPQREECGESRNDTDRMRVHEAMCCIRTCPVVVVRTIPGRSMTVRSGTSGASTSMIIEWVLKSEAALAISASARIGCQAHKWVSSVTQAGIVFGKPSSRLQDRRQKSQTHQLAC
jgi:hypothetical protein